jgi:hypothetical protein
MRYSTTVRRDVNLGNISAASLHAGTKHPRECSGCEPPSKRGSAAVEHHQASAREPTAGILVDTAVGERPIVAQFAIEHRLKIPDGAVAERMGPLLLVADTISSSVPTSSAAKIRAAVALWREALTWFEVSTQNITVAVPIALIVARCCPPVGFPLPVFLRRRVLPVTAAADVDTMRRAALLGVQGMEGSLPSLADHRVLALQRAIGGRARRITTSKRLFCISK